MTPEPDSVDRLAERLAALEAAASVRDELVDEIVGALSALRDGYEQQRRETQRHDERLMVVEKAWRRHGEQVDSIKERQELHCLRLRELDARHHLHGGCGERLESEDALKRAWVGDPVPAYSLEDDE